jgi:hypothetical protein
MKQFCLCRSILFVYFPEKKKKETVELFFPHKADPVSLMKEDARPQPSCQFPGYKTAI